MAAWEAAIAEGAAATATAAAAEAEAEAPATAEAAEAGCARPAAEWALVWPLRLDDAPAGE